MEKKLKLEKEKKEKISNEVLELEKHERKYFEVLREIQVRYFFRLFLLFSLVIHSKFSCVP